MLENAITTFKYVLENYGLQAAFLLLIFVRDCWLFWTQSKQITSLQNEIKGVVIPLVGSTSEALAKSSVALNDSVEALRENRMVLSEVRETLRVALE